MIPNMYPNKKFSHTEKAIFLKNLKIWQVTDLKNNFDGPLKQLSNMRLIARILKHFAALLIMLEIPEKNYFDCPTILFSN